MDHVANYPVVRKLGEGATSEVFLCQDPFHGREVAVKRIFPESLRDPARGRLFRKLFFTEASLAGKLNHPHIAQIFDAGIGEDSGYIVMEYVPGGTMERFCAPENLLPVEHTVEIIFKCARALAYAHKQGVTHRDIKPGNLLYAAAPTDVRVGDFGLALNLGVETTQITGVGSPAYMSPEQIREELVDHRTDIYSLGVVMYQMLTGKLPFQGTNKFSMIYQITQFEPAPPSSHRHEVPEALDRIVRRAMHKDSRGRYQTADELADELVEALRSGLGAQRRIVFGDADKFAALRNMPFFRRFAEPELWELVRVGLWERVPAATELVREGDPGDFFCLLVEGEARVTKNRKLLTVLGPGECFGEMAYLSLDRRERGATVTTSKDSHVVRIRIADLEKATVSCRSNVDRAFIGILVERLNLANTRLTSG
jgi:tRNA A-37 threonylcarbamoyl transferase component Bud32